MAITIVPPPVPCSKTAKNSKAIELPINIWASPSITKINESIRAI